MLILSDQTADADERITLPNSPSMRQNRLRKRRSRRILRVIPYHLDHVGPLYRGPVLGVRVAQDAPEPRRKLFALDALYQWRIGWWCRCCRHDPVRRCQGELLDFPLFHLPRSFTNHSQSRGVLLTRRPYCKHEDLPTTKGYETHEACLKL